MNIKVQREKRGITQMVLSEKMKVTQATISMWESGEVRPTADKLPLLARVLECTIDELYGETKSTPLKEA